MISLKQTRPEPKMEYNAYKTDAAPLLNIAIQELKNCFDHPRAAPYLNRAARVSARALANEASNIGFALCRDGASPSACIALSNLVRHLVAAEAFR